MIATRRIPAPEARELRACALAALAEAGVVALPVHLVVTESGGAPLDLLPFVIAFALAYVLGSVATCRFRAATSVPVVAAVVAVVGGVAAGQADVTRSVFTTVLALVVAFRVVTLGVRDWRTPLHAEIAWFAVALGLEAAIASGPEPGWRPVLAVVVPVFFVASLASRASTVWTGGGVGDLDDRVRRAWIRRAVIATVALLGVMAVAVVLSIRGGLFDRVGEALTPAADAFARFLGWGLGQASRPFLWLVDRLGIDPEAVREFFERLREGGLGDRARDRIARPEAALWQRLLGMAVFLAVGYAIVRAIRRLRPRPGAEESSGAPTRLSERPLDDVEVAGPGAARIRPELPADAVRRWYAETLIALGARGVEKPGSATPAEFAEAVSVAYPEHRADFLALTRAYEDVRYGSLRLSAGDLEALGRRVAGALRSVRDRAPDLTDVPGALGDSVGDPP